MSTESDYHKGYEDGQEKAFVRMLLIVCITVFVIFGIMATCSMFESQQYNICRASYEADSSAVKQNCARGSFR